MRIFPPLLAATAAVVACSDQPVPSGPAPAPPSLTTYATAVSAPDVLGAYNNSTYTIAYDINDLGGATGESGPGFAVVWATGTAPAPASTTALFVASGAAGRATNAAGQVAGEHLQHAALWTPSAGGYVLTDIGAELAATFSATLSTAYGMNAMGQVVGNYTRPDGAGGFIDRCFLWTPASPDDAVGSAVTLPDLGGAFCVANDINSAGRVAGTSSVPGAGAAHAFVWTPTVPNGTSGTIADLLPTGESYGTAINDASQVAGFHGSGIGERNAAVWTPTGPSTWSLLDLSPPPLTGQAGVIISAAHDINDAGFVVGYTQDKLDPGYASRAFLWHDGTFTELPDPDGSQVAATSLTNLLGNLVVVAGADIVGPTVSDRHGLRWSVTVTPVSSEGCIERLVQRVEQMRADGVLAASAAKSLLAKLDAATRQIAQERTTPAKNLLSAFINEVSALVASGRLTSTEAQPLIDDAMCAISAL